MKWFYDLKIRTKLTTAFVAVAVVMALVGAVGIFGLHKIDGLDVQLYEHNTQPLGHLAFVGTSYLRARVAQRELVETDDQAKKQSYMAEITAADQVMNDELAAFEKEVSTKEIREGCEALKAALGAYLPVRNGALQRALGGGGKASFGGKGQFLAYNVDAALDGLYKIMMKEGQKKSDANTGTMKSVRGLMIALMAVGVVFAVGFGLFIARTISDPIKEAVRFSKEVATGDLSRHLAVGRKDETGELAISFNGMIDELRTMMSEVKASSDAVASASREMSTSSGQMSSGLGEGTRRITQIASAVEEMGQSITEIARSAAVMATSAAKASEQADGGGKIVHETVDEVKSIAQAVERSGAMVGSLGEHSRQIGEIVTVISDIADQTNLLALNAAIEAARAGEQGRGFAVVADEVRKLAERTAEATSQISGIVRAIQKEMDGTVKSMGDGAQRVKVGVEHANHAGEALRNIVTSVGEAPVDGPADSHGNAADVGGIGPDRLRYGSGRHDIERGGGKLGRDGPLRHRACPGLCRAAAGCRPVQGIGKINLTQDTPVPGQGRPGVSRPGGCSLLSVVVS